MPRKRWVLLALSCLPYAFVGPGPVVGSSHLARRAEAKLWQEASEVERSRSELLLGKLEEKGWLFGVVCR